MLTQKRRIWNLKGKLWIHMYDHHSWKSFFFFFLVLKPMLRKLELNSLWFCKTSLPDWAGAWLFVLLELLWWGLLDENNILKYSSSNEKLFQDVNQGRSCRGVSVQSMPSSPVCSAEPDELQADNCPYQPFWTVGSDPRSTLERIGN